MPESANPKLYTGTAIDPPTEVTPSPYRYAELDVTTNFSFLRGASHPDELVFTAAMLGCRAMAVTDINTLAAVVRAHQAAKKVKGFRLIVGTRLVFNDGCPDLLVWPRDRAAYARLCRLITLGRRRAPKGECHFTLADFLDFSDGQFAAVAPPWPWEGDVPNPGTSTSPSPGISGGGRGRGSSRSAASQHRSSISCGKSDPLPNPPPEIPGEGTNRGEDVCRRLREALGPRLSLAIHLCGSDDDQGRLQGAMEFGKRMGIPLLATNHVHYHTPARRALQDVLTCVRHGCTIQEAGFKLFPNAERHLKSPEEMARLFALCPRALERSMEIAGQCQFSLDELRYDYPTEVVPPGRSPSDYLRELTYAGADKQYPQGIPAAVQALLEKELNFICHSKYESYFLTVYDLVDYARSKDILCQGRGSAANSAVCYCLGVTAVDPAKFQLVFERFASAERSEPPDIDIDFEHERREEVIQYVYQKYGRDRTAMTASLITYRGRSAVRDVGKALGFSQDTLDQLAGKLDWWHRGTLSPAQLRETGVDPQSRAIHQLVWLTSELLGFPRHLSQHVGGMVISQTPLCEIVPVENAAMEDRTVIEWDKDDLDELSIFKVDILALGMLTCIAKGLALINAHRVEPNPPPPEWAASKAIASIESNYLPPPVLRPSALRLRLEEGRAGEGAELRKAFDAIPPPQPSPGVPGEGEEREPPIEMHTVPHESPGVYDMICDADTVGVFQIESRAQMSMLPRLRPREFYDLVIEVAIVRPGPIQGDMVHPYLQRREARRADPNYQIQFPKEELRTVLEKTLGVPLFQEQVMRLAMVAAGFSGGEADQLRRAMAAWKRSGGLVQFHDKFVNGMTTRGYDATFAEQCFKQICGFGEYGFPESHAASFAKLVYVSAWIKRFHPAAFAAALINSQPMGFYAPAQIIRDAREHGVDVRPIDVNASEWDCTLEYDSGAAPASAQGHKSQWGIGAPALRLGFRLIKGMRQQDAQRITAARCRIGSFTSVAQVQYAANVEATAIHKLATADALNSIRLNRRHAAWEAMALSSVAAPLFDGLPEPAPSAPAPLPVMREDHEVIADYAATGLSLKRHPVSFARPALKKWRVSTAIEIQNADRFPNGERVSIAGLVLVRQRPGTASGVVFVTIEDETGVANLIIWASTYERYRRDIRYATLLQVDGIIQREGQVIHVLARRMWDRTKLLEGLQQTSRDFQ
jgi:error-prone DNA polymerase